MLPIQILPPLLFRIDFPGYRGLQYVHDFLVFWVVSNFFKCKKSLFSRHGLPVNSHANFTYSFPTLQIILIPTLTRSNCFLIYQSWCPHMPPHDRVTILVCDIDLLVVRHTTLPKHLWLSWSICFGVCTLLAESNHLLLQKAITYYLWRAHYCQKLSIF